MVKREIFPLPTRIAEFAEKVPSNAKLYWSADEVHGWIEMILAPDRRIDLSELSSFDEEY